MRLESLTVACLLHHYQVVRLARLGTDPENLPILAAKLLGWRSTPPRMHPILIGVPGQSLSAPLRLANANTTVIGALLFQAGSYDNYISSSKFLSVNC
jgi:hypothetical protein